MGWAFIPKSPGASERKIAMGEKTTPKSRLVLNGQRLLEGQGSDWYREGDKIVLVNQRVRQGDVILMEYPDFSEELLPIESLWHPCHRCPLLVPTLRTLCPTCTINSLKEEIAQVEEKIEDQKKLLGRMRDELNKLEQGS